MPINIYWDTLYEKLFDHINRLTHSYATLADMHASHVAEDRAIADRIEGMADISAKNPEALYQSALTLMRDGYTFTYGVNVPICRRNGKLILVDYDSMSKQTMLHVLVRYLHYAYSKALRSVNKGR